jgi:hypothetical protein
VLVHAVQPERQPTAARLEERNLEPWEALDAAARDHRQRRQHLLERVRDHVRHEEIVEAVEPGRRQLPVSAFMEHDRHPKPLRLGAEPVVRGVVQRPPADWVRPEINALEAERRDGVPQLVDRRADVEQGHHADADQAAAVGGKYFS